MGNEMGKLCGGRSKKKSRDGAATSKQSETKDIKKNYATMEDYLEALHVAS